MTQFKGKYRGEFGAIHHEDVAGYVFTVEPAKLAPDVAWALNASLHAAELLRVLKQARNQVVAFAIKEIGAEAAVEAVEYIDDAIEQASPSITKVA